MYHGIALAVFLSVLSISAVYRWRARRSGAVVTRGQEGRGVIALRLACAAPLYGSVLVFLLQPRWMEWARYDSPSWLQQIGVALGAASVPAAWWVFSNLGRNVSETVLTKADHALVMSGPYHWVWHPLYTTFTMLLLGVGLMAANWFMLAFVLAATVMIRVFAVPTEEEALIAKFGAEYRQYRLHTGALLPQFRCRNHAWSDRPRQT